MSSSSSSSAAAGREEMSPGDLEDPGDQETVSGSKTAYPDNRSSVSVPESYRQQRDVAAASTRAAARTFGETSSQVPRMLGNIASTTGPDLEVVGSADISRQTQGMEKLQQQLNDQFKALIDEQKKFEEAAKGKTEAEIAELSRQADVVAEEKKAQIMAIYMEMGKYASTLAVRGQISMPQVVTTAAAAQAELAEFKIVRPSKMAIIQVWYNKYCRPYVRSVYNELPDPLDVAVAGIFATSLLGSGVAVAQLAVPAVTTAAASAALNMVAPIPYATPTVLVGMCDVVGSSLFGGLSLACLIALLSNDGTRNQIQDALRRGVNTIGAAAAPVGRAGMWIASEVKSDIQTLCTATEDAINNLGMSVRTSLENAAIRAGIATHGNEEDYTSNVETVQRIIDQIPGGSERLVDIARKNNIPCIEGSECNPQNLQLTATALSQANSRAASTVASAANSTVASAASSTFRPGQQGAPKASASAFTSKGKVVSQELIGKLADIEKSQQQKRQIDEINTGSSSSSSSSKKQAKGDEDDEAGNDDMTNEGGRRRKSKQRKTKQRKTKRQVKRRRQTKKGKKRSQTKKVVRRMSLQSQMKQQKQKMSSQQMQQQMMNQQMMKYNSKMF